ncbi:hypothetical protein GDO86_019437 [Hymenochirus boettgeri]|uniref:EF-hand domain-containing protein n=1 Tax=Hymenochirus boettgeri TaxID=247094 RepID=A0A8T2IKM6_9PIPI|nr:hypothetical protein GDO86_019437 [Hymenochirus boettgeri]
MATIETLFDDIWTKFRELDPHKTGCVTTEEFIDILQDLSPDLTQHQCDKFSVKFSVGRGRVSYVQFLQPYQTERLRLKESPAKTERKFMTQEESVEQGLMSFTSTLRQKLSAAHWKNLHQTCRKLDTNGTGFLHLNEFRSVLNLCNVVLDDDEVFKIMSNYDKDLAGKINYAKLVADHKRGD